MRKICQIGPLPTSLQDVKRLIMHLKNQISSKGRKDPERLQTRPRKPAVKSI